MANPKRLIDMDETLKRLRDYADRKCLNGHSDTANGILNAVSYIRNNMASVDAVEVVRCIDCRYSVAPKCQREYCEEKGILKCDKPGGIAFNRRVYSTDFCPYGKRRDDC